MQTANFVEALQADLRELAQIGGEELVQSAQRLEGAVKQSATLRLIDAAHRRPLSSFRSSFRTATSTSGSPGRSRSSSTSRRTRRRPSRRRGDDEQTRITLRLPESLKAALEVGRGRRGRLGQHVARPRASAGDLRRRGRVAQPAVRQAHHGLLPSLKGAHDDLLPNTLRSRRDPHRQPRPAARAAAPGREVRPVRRETFNTPGALRLDLRLPSGEIEVETVDGDETRRRARLRPATPTRCAR